MATLNERWARARENLTADDNDTTNKGWSAATCRRLKVGREGDRFLFAIQDADGTTINLCRYSDTGAVPKMLAETGQPRNLWPRPEDLPHQILYVVEGEPDALSLAEAGLNAVAYPGTGAWQPDWATRIAAGRDAVFVIADCDKPGRKKAAEVAAAIAATRVDTFLLDLDPNLTDGWDVGDLLAEYGPEDTRRIIASLAYQAKPLPLPEPRQQTGRVAFPIDFTDVVIRPVQYLWRPYLPLGKVVLVAGAPGHGKSQLSALFAAHTTRASFTPSDLAEPARALLFTAEDDLADTVVPRLMAVNADLRLCSTVQVRTTHADGLIAAGQIKLPDELPTLHTAIRTHRPALAVMDPVVSYIGRSHSTTSNQDVRDVLDPLKSIAETYLCTIVLILHFNKAAEIREWSARIAESHGFQAIARSVMVLGPDPEDPEGERGVMKILALPKSNLQKKIGMSIRMKIVGTAVQDARGGQVETSRLDLLGFCDTSADDLLMNDEQRATRNDALAWLYRYLGDGWKKANDLKRESASEGHSWRTIQRLRSTHCQTAKQNDTPHGPWWVAIQGVTAPIPPQGGALENGQTDPSGHAATLPGKRGALVVLEGGEDPQGRQDAPITQYPGGLNAPSPNHTANTAKGVRTKEQIEFMHRMLGERDDDDDDNNEET